MTAAQSIASNDRLDTIRLCLAAASPCVFEHDRRIGYDLVDLRSKAHRPLACTGLEGEAGLVAGQAFAPAAGPEKVSGWNGTAAVLDGLRVF